jgi:hypothetical protein
MNTEKDHAEENARAWISSIVEMVAALTAAHDLENDDAQDAALANAEQTIRESVLSVQVRSGWYDPCGSTETSSAPAEYEILLTTGGPACRIIGELNEHGDPTCAELQKQGWGTPWARVTESRRNALLTFAQQFYYGEGE